MSNLTIPKLFAELPFGTANNRLLSAISFGDSSSVDAFGRLRISIASTQLDSILQYGKLPLVWGESITGAGANSVHLPNESAVLMTVGTVSGDKVIRQTHKYFRYQPAKSQLISMTGVLGAPTANVRTRLGYFDANNGVFFQQSGDTLSVVLRSFVSGAVVDSVVPQTQWSLDMLDGTGRSKLLIDPSFAQIFIMDLQWLGVGRVRMGLQINGRLFYCHEFLNANKSATTYMTTANLPSRYEIETIGATVAGGSLKHICSSVSSEGGTELASGRLFSKGNGVSPIGVTSRRPILTIRPRALFNSIMNRGLIVPIGLQFRGITNDAYFEVVKNGALANSSFSNVDANNSITELDVAATSITGGQVLFGGFVSSGAGAISSIASETIFPLS